MKPNNDTPPSPELATMSLTLDVDRIPGDRVASIVDEVHGLGGDEVLLTDLRSEPVVLELSGPRPAMEKLRTAMLQDGLRRVHGTWRVTIGGLRRHCLPPSQRARLVLLVDGEDARARGDADALVRAGMDPWVVGGVGPAVTLLQRTALPFDAVVVRHHQAAGGNGLQLLDRVRAGDRRCSVLVIDDRARPEIARAYRVRGAFRYVAQPQGPLQLISRVHATVLDTQAWRRVEQPGAADRDDEPPRQLVDPEHAADRLQFVCELSPLERDVASMVLRGLRDLDIARLIDKSERTAKRHVGKVLAKAGVGNRASLWAVLFKDAIGGLDGHDRREPAPQGEPTAGSAGTSPSRPSSVPPALHAPQPSA